MLTSLGEIRRDEGCLEFVPNQDKIEKDDQVLVARCHGQKGHQEWIYNEVLRNIELNDSTLCSAPFRFSNCTMPLPDYV